MKTRLTLKPGHKGTKKLQQCDGEKLVCVRYRYDEVTHRRYKTAELIMEEIAWPPKSPVPDPNGIVAIKVRWGEIDLGQRVRNAGGGCLDVERSRRRDGIYGSPAMNFGDAFNKLPIF